MGEPRNWKSALARFAEWFSRLAYINILWIAFTLLGLVLFGFIPATVAMFAVIRQWGMGTLDDRPLFSIFWGYYRQEFFKANAAGLIMALIGYVMYIDIFVYEFPATMMMQVIKFIIFIIAFFYLLIAVFFFPVYVHFNLKWYQYLKMAALMVFAAPLRALLMLFLAYGIYFLMAKMPIVMVFFLGSSISYLWLMISLPTFHKLQNGREHPVQENK